MLVLFSPVYFGVRRAHKGCLSSNSGCDNAVVRFAAALDSELHEMGWRPVMMRDEATGMPFTRWFPPAKAEIDREFTADNVDFPPNFENGPDPLAVDY